MAISIEVFKEYLGYSDKSSPTVNFAVPPDSIIQLHLDLSQKICLNKIGNPDDVPTTPTFENSVYFLGRYFLETRSKEGKQWESDFSTLLQERRVNPGILEDKIHSAVMRVLTGMLSSDRDVLKFMPEVSNDSS